MKAFTHLHLHTTHSLLDGFTKISDLVNVVREYGMKAVAITDHGNMSGIPELFKEAKDANIKPICGLEAYICEDATVRGGGKDDKRPYYHITLLARSLRGYRNLCKLSTLSWTEGFYSKPRLDPTMLAMHGQDVIVLTGCVGGWPATSFLGGKPEEARSHIDTLRSTCEAVYGELTYTGEPDQARYNKWLIEMAGKDGFPLVVTGDSHYTWKEQYHDHDTLFAMGLHKLKDDKARLRFNKNEYYVKSQAEMYKIGLPESAVANSFVISNSCENYDLPRAGGLPEAVGTMEDLYELAFIGLEEKCGGKGQYLDRLLMELEVIRELKYERHFLVAHDICRFVRQNGLTTGWGRGSSTGSLTSYCLGITGVDPIRHNLYFERFLNASRGEPPDIDLDFSDEDRAIVVDYIKSKYGDEHVSNIATYGTLGPRQVIIDSAKCLGKNELTIKTALECVPHDPTWKVQNVLESEGIMSVLTMHLGEEVTHAMEAFQEIPRSASVHAAGFLIDSSNLADDLPFMQTKAGGLASQYDYDTLKSLGYEKFDILGVRTLRVIRNCADLVNVDLFGLPPGDSSTFDLLSRGDTVGVFQLEGWGYQQFLKKFRPRSFDDVMLLNALYRPGPMQGGKGLDEIVARRHGRADIRYLHHSLQQLLKDTYGVMVYQEQVMGAVHILAGWDLAKADYLRWAIGKKKIDVIRALRPEFVSDCQRAGHKQVFAEEAFTQIEYFSRYGWNKAHAAAYGMVTYVTAYLKAHYRKEYMTCLLNTELGNHEKLGKLYKDINRSNIRLHSPHINESALGFSTHNGGILVGLAALRGIGEKAGSAIVRDREASGSFTSVRDFEARIPRKAVHSGMREILKKYGAFRDLPQESDIDHIF